LVGLSLEMELTPSVLTFLCRNNLRIIYLYLHVEYDSLPQTSLCTFPLLELYNGSFKLMPAFLPGSPVQAITANIYDVDDVEYILPVLSNTTLPLESISIISAAWNLRFFECLSQHAPGILDIEFRSNDEDADAIEVCKIILSPSGRYSCSDQAFMTSITSVISKFRCIQCLNMSYFEDGPGRKVDTSHFLDDFKVLQSWRQLCPSLKVSRLPTRE
jgi:hypothetical protein